MVIFIFMLTEREKPIKLIFKLTACAILSLILPAMWYYAAYKQGGEQFLSLVMEENVGRLALLSKKYAQPTPYKSLRGWHSCLSLFSTAYRKANAECICYRAIRLWLYS